MILQNMSIKALTWVKSKILVFNFLDWWKVLCLVKKNLTKRKSIWQALPILKIKYHFIFPFFDRCCFHLCDKHKNINSLLICIGTIISVLKTQWHFKLSVCRTFFRLVGECKCRGYRITTLFYKWFSVCFLPFVGS